MGFGNRLEFEIQYQKLGAKDTWYTLTDKLNLQELNELVHNWRQLWSHPSRVHQKAERQINICNNLAMSLRKLARITGNIQDLDEAISYHKKALSKSTPDDPRIFVLYGNLGNTLSDRFHDFSNHTNDLDQAIDYYRQAVSSSKSREGLKKLYGDQNDIKSSLARVLTTKSVLTNKKAYLNEAISLYQHCIQDTNVNDPSLAMYYHGLGTALLDLFWCDKSTSSLDIATQALKKAVELTDSNAPDYAGSLLNLSKVYLARYYHLGQKSDLEQSIEILVKVYDFDPNNKSITRPASKNLAASYKEMYKETGCWEYLEKALKFFEYAYSLDETNSISKAWILIDYADALYLNWSHNPSSQEELERAIKFCQLASSQFEKFFSNSPASYKLGHQSNLYRWQDIIINIYLQAIETWPNRREYWHQQLITLIEGNKSRVLLESLKYDELPPPRNTLNNLIDKEQALLEQLVAIDNREIALYDMMPSISQSSWQQRQEVLNELEQVWQEIKWNDPEYVSIRQGHQLTWNAIQQILSQIDRDTALMSLYISKNKTYLFLVKPYDNCPLLFIEETLTLSRWESTVQLFEREVTRGKGKIARETWLMYLLPFLKTLKSHLQNIDKILFSADGIGHLLPWNVLAHHAEWNTVVISTPSLWFFDLIQNRSSTDKLDVLVVGNPRPSKECDLINAENEAVMVANHFDTEALLRNNATKENILNKLQVSHTAHFACHAGQCQSLSVESPFDYGIILANDECLTAREIIEQQLNVSNFLILSACESGKTKSFAGNELMGISQSFLYAGSNSIIASLWQIDDEATTYFMKEYYRRLSSQDKAEALRLAMSKTRNKWPSTFFWGAFSLIGSWH